ncbi:hypothetical protein FDW83_18015 [Pseudarthrobacter sp. NamE2]|uniref:hypothetical protein n=1 Tax=Pseudarthrobacter sp. NamE2 TaxID=2576838 RepID=UPI0010FD5329|nr:hypothetical protein [Pseudarthrobacter sp. NamE2]TLM80970.1 hypothetical protein FDW83_18015 [Pseudarthrobacter sp. NamE2]
MRRYDRYLTVEQASKALNVDINQVLGMLRTGELGRSPKGAGAAEMVSSTDIQLARRRLESLRCLDGDQQ